MLKKKHEKRKKYLIVLYCVFLLCYMNGCGSSDVNLQDRSYQESVINNYLNNLQEGNVEEALKNVYFVQEDKESGYLERLKETMETTFSYKEYSIEEIEQINEFIYLAKVTIKSNAYSEDKDTYIDEEFNPYLCIINNKIRIVYSKDRIPSNLYEDIENIPNNYSKEIEDLRTY